MFRRGLAVLAAVGLAAVAVVVAYADLRSSHLTGPNRNLASVYEVRATVPRDEPATAAYARGLITRTQIPRRFVPAGALTSLAAVGDRVAGFDLPPGEVVVSGMFVAPAAVSGAAAQTLPAGDVAVSVAVDPAESVAGLIVPGDKVDVLLDDKGVQEIFLYRSVTVLAVNTTLPAAVGGASHGAAPAVAQPVTTVTFAVAPADASRIALASQLSGGATPGVYLALEGAGSTPPAPTTIQGANLIPGSTSSPGSAAVSNPPGAVHGGGKNEPTP